MGARSRQPHTRAATLLLVTAVAGLGAFGCGGGDSSTGTTTRDATSAPAPGPGAAGGSTAAAPTGDSAASEREHGAGGSSQRTGGASGQDSPHPHPGGTAEAGSKQEGGRGASGVAGSQSYQAAVRKAKASCPRGLSPAQCEETVKQYGSAAPGPTVPASTADDCVAVMGQAECEALLAKQQAAAKEGESVSVDECLREPTPRCEAVFGPVIKQQTR